MGNLFESESTAIFPRERERERERERGGEVVEEETGATRSSLGIVAENLIVKI